MKKMNLGILWPDSFAKYSSSQMIRIKSLPKFWTSLKTTILEGTVYSEYNHTYFVFFFFNTGMLLSSFSCRKVFIPVSPFLFHTINNSNSLRWHFYFIAFTWLTYFCFWVLSDYFILAFNLGDLKLDTKF